MKKSIDSRVLKCSVALAALCAAAPAFAQDLPAGTAAESGKEISEDSEILVTGTLIRGIAPVGTETIRVTPQDIAESGGVTTNEVLAKIPQVSFFNRQSTAGNDAGVGRQRSVDQPSVHGLPTLILMDGHRVASAGAGANGSPTSVDPSIIPRGVLAGIEIVPDGGSALYGSDAVGGVLNFSTIKRFDGIKLDGNVGFADAYRSYRGNVTVGKDWGSGSIYASYAYYQASGLLGADRPYIEQHPRIATCTPATVIANAGGGQPAVQYSYTGVGADGRPTAYTAGAASCSRYTYESVLPAEHQHSVFAGLSQDLSAAIHVDIRAFYSTRESKSFNANTLVATVVVPSTNPFYTPTPAQLGTNRTQSVGFSLAPAVGPNLPGTNKLDTWGVTSEFAADVGASFQVRLLGNYNQSSFDSRQFGFNDGTLLAQALARTDPTTALNPYNPAQTPGSIAVARQIVNTPTTDRGRSRQTQARLITDGTLFHLPGGDVKIAAGVELLHEGFDSSTRRVNYLGNLIAGTATRLSASRTVMSAYGELEVPLISPENELPIYALRLSAAGRYDHYNDFGETFNPRFAASLLPAEWLTLRGTYGRSFVAPALPQLYQPQVKNLSNTAFILPAGSPPGTTVLILTGGNPNLQPQKATTWSLGVDLKIPFVEGLRASLTYYNVRFKDRLGNPPFTSAALFYTPTYAAYYIQNPTYQQAVDFIGPGNPSISAPTGVTTLEALYGAAPDRPRIATSPTYISSGRVENIAAENQEGVDFDVSYKRSVSFGSLDFSVAGNYLLKKDSAANGVTFTNSLRTEARFKGTASVGANVENLRFSATLFHTSGYGLPVNTTGQTRVDAYDTVDAYLGYTFKDEGFLQDTVVSLQVTNLFDVRPPVNLTASSGYGFGSILGRVFQLGLTKKF